MNDQAAKLRNLMKSDPHLRSKRQTGQQYSPVRRIAVTSGKGGVGKSNFSLNLGICFQMLERRTLLVDADTNLANIDILLGIHPQYTLADAIIGDRSLPEVIIQGPQNLSILPAASGVVELVGLNEVIRNRLESALADICLRRLPGMSAEGITSELWAFGEKGMGEGYFSPDMVIFDTSAGISSAVVDLVGRMADEVIVITTPEPTAITDAYAAIKVISRTAEPSSTERSMKFYLIVNFANNEKEASEVARKIKLVVENYLTLQLHYLGFLPVDRSIPASVAQQKPFLLNYPKCPASRNLKMIARRLLIK